MRLLQCTFTAVLTLTILGLGAARAGEVRAVELGAGDVGAGKVRVGAAADSSIATACGIVHVGNDFYSRDAYEKGLLEVVAWYDGAEAKPVLKLQLVAPSGVTGFIHIGVGYPGGGIRPANIRIETRHYSIGDCRMTGLAEVVGVVPNGGIDGIAFGVLAQYTDFTWRLVKSVGPPSISADFVGAWPLAVTSEIVQQRATDLTHALWHQRAWTALFGAQVLGNGTVVMVVR